jgi:predicted RNA binding protein YcfA (HicA-like mRNA interferase family)
MTKLPRVTGEEMTRALVRTGFAVVRLRGSHQILQHSDGRVTVIPTHAGETMGPRRPPRLRTDPQRVC